MFYLWENLVAWAEAYPGLGGWVGAVGSVFAVFASYLLARWEFRRDRRAATAAHNGAIDRFIQVIEGYDADLQLRGAKAPADMATWVRWCSQLNKPGKRALANLNGVPAQIWPSLQSFLDFKEYASAVFNLENTAAKIEPDYLEETLQQIADFRAKSISSLRASRQR